MNAPTPSGNDDDRRRVAAYVLVALAALFTGYILGLLGGQDSGAARGGGPTTNPRSLNP